MITDCKKGIAKLENDTKPIEDYLWLLNHKKDKDYDKRFNQLFGLNRLTKKQRVHIGKFILGTTKTNSFGELVVLMDKNKYFFSFASKIMHTIDNDLPIYDSRIANEIHWKFQNKKSALKRCKPPKAKVNELNRLWEEFQKTWNEYTKKDTKHCCELFDKAFPKYKHLSPTKKIDFMLWASKKA